MLREKNSFIFKHAGTHQGHAEVNYEFSFRFHFEILPKKQIDIFVSRNVTSSCLNNFSLLVFLKYLFESHARDDIAIGRPCGK